MTNYFWTGLSQTDTKRIESLSKKSISDLNKKLKIIKGKKEILFRRSILQNRSGNIIDARTTNKKITSLTNSEFQIEQAIKLKLMRKH